MADDFLPTYAPLANDIATRTGVDPSVVLGIIDTETGGGKHVLGNNIFGITPPGGVARYPDVQTAANAFITLMQTPRYQGVAAAGDPASQAVALVRGGYNTVNPQYASIVANKALSIGKQLGYQDKSGGSTEEGPAVHSTSSQSAATTDQPPAPSDSDTFFPSGVPQQPAQPPATTGSAKDRVLSDPALGGTSSAAPAQPSTASTAKDRVLNDPALAAPAQKSTTPTQPGPGVPSPDEQSAETGLPLPSSPSPALNRITAAAAEGWSGVPDIPRVPSNLVMSPIYNPLITGAETVLRAGGAMLRGGQQAASEIAEPIGEAIPFIGGPGLGRDIAALPEAFPFGVNALRPPGRPPIAEAPPPGPRFVSELTAPPRPPGMTDAARINQLVEHAVNEEQPAVGPPMARGPATQEAVPPPRSQGGAGATQPAGAQVTPGYEAIHTPAEEAAYRATAEGKKLLEPQVIGEQDLNQYIPGETVNNAEREQTVKTARELKELGIRVPEASQVDKAAADSNNTARTIYLDNTTKGPVEINNERVARQTDIEADKVKVFAPDNVTGPVDLKPVIDHMEAVLDQPFNRQNTALQQAYRPWLERMKAIPDGAIQDPEEAWGLRYDIDQQTDKFAQRDNPNMHRVAHQLGGAADAIDSQIEKVAPGYADMLARYKEHSRAIDEMEVLQGAKDKFRGPGQKLTYNDFQRYMKNVVDSRMTPSTDLNGFKAISPENMQRLWNIRDSLRRTASAQELAKAAGSDTMPNVIDALKAVGKMGGTAALHAYVGSHLGPGGNLALQSLGQIGRTLNDRRMIRRAVTQMNQLLRPSEPLRVPPGQENPLSGAPPP